MGGATAVAIEGGWTRSNCSLETNYFCMKVPEDPNRSESVLVRILDRLVHSYSDLQDPKRLEYGYEKVYAEATRYLSLNHEKISALSIGGGGYTFPRYMEAVYPDSDLDVIEIDPGVTQTANALLGLRPTPGAFVQRRRPRLPGTRARPPVPADHGRCVQRLLRSVSSDHAGVQRADKAWLADDGMYMVNLIDGPRRDFLRAYVNTLRQTFEHVYVVPAIRSGASRRGSPL